MKRRSWPEVLLDELGVIAESLLISLFVLLTFSLMDLLIGYKGASYLDVWAAAFGAAITTTPWRVRWLRAKSRETQ